MRSKKGEHESSLGWIRSAVGRLYTEDALRKDLLALTPKDRLTIVTNMVPKININENDGLVVRIILDGIINKKMIRGQVIEQDALPEHDG